MKKLMTLAVLSIIVGGIVAPTVVEARSGGFRSSSLRTSSFSRTRTTAPKTTTRTPTRTTKSGSTGNTTNYNNYSGGVSGIGSSAFLGTFGGVILGNMVYDSIAGTYRDSAGHTLSASEYEAAVAQYGTSTPIQSQSDRELGSFMTLLAVTCALSISVIIIICIIALAI
jgi:hypothetical protein